MLDGCREMAPTLSDPWKIPFGWLIWTMHPAEEDADRDKQASNHDMFSGLLIVIRTSDHTVGFDNNNNLQRLHTLARVCAVETENME